MKLFISFMVNQEFKLANTTLYLESPIDKYCFTVHSSTFCKCKFIISIII